MNAATSVRSLGLFRICRRLVEDAISLALRRSFCRSNGAGTLLLLLSLQHFHQAFVFLKLNVELPLEIVSLLLNNASAIVQSNSFYFHFDLRH